MTKELYDILDRNGKPTGKSLSADEVHAKQLWHGVAHIWIYNSKGEMLMQRRHPNKSWGGNKWDLAGGGHICAGEQPIKGALREVREEIGVNLKIDELKFIGITIAQEVNSSWNLEHRILAWNYISEKNLDTPKLILQHNETTDIRWFKLEDIEKDLIDPIKAKKYTSRDPYMFLMATTEIRNELQRQNQGKL